MTAFAAPTSESAIGEAVLDASAQKSALRIIAGGTRSGIGHPGDVAHALDVSGVSGITRYEPGSLTLEARTGTPMHEIDAALADENQMLAFEPMDHRALLGTRGTPTIGGVVACNVSGPRRFLSGACRDFLLGARFVDGRGRILKNGGRVMKNVTGLDLTKLVCGSYGTLGVLSEVALKVLPRPERAATLQFEGMTEADAVALFSKATTTAYEVSGAAWQNGVAMLRVEGLASQVDYRLGKLKTLFSAHASTVLSGDVHRDLWSALRDVHAFAGSDDSIWRVSIRATDAPALVAAVKAQLQARVILDQGGSVVWLAVPSESPDQAEAIRRQIPAGNGYATLVRGTQTLRKAVPVFQPQHPRLTQISEGVRRAFDPDRILNPGLMAA